MGETEKPSKQALSSGRPSHSAALAASPASDFVLADLREIVNNSNDMIYTQDLNANFIWVNEAALRMTGYSLEEALRMNMTDIVAPEYHALADRMRRSRLKGNSPPAYEVEIIRKDGRRIPVEVSTRLIYRDGKPVGAQGAARDISERKKAEAELSRTEDRFRSLVQKSSDMITIYDRDGKILYESPSVMHVLGYVPEELEETSAFGHVHPEDLPKVRQAFEAVVNGTNELHTLEFRYRHKNGGWRVLEATARNLMDDPAIGGIVTNCRDVTDRRHAIDALRRSEERYRVLFERNLAGVYWLTGEGELVDCNESFARMFGFKARSEVMLNPRGDFYHPGEGEAILRRVKCEKSLINVESLCRKKDGSPIWILQNITALEEGPAGLMIQGTVIDITERKFAEQNLRQAEGKFRSIFENAAEGIFQTALDGRWLIANPKLAQILGYNSPEELTHAVDLAGSNYYVDPGRRREFVRRLEKEGSVYGFESQVYRKDGSVIWISETSRCVRDDFGHLVGFEGTIQDITERKNAEDTLRQNEQRLRKQNEILLELSQRKALQSGSLSNALAEITRSAGETLDVEYASVWLFNTDRTSIRCADVYSRTRGEHSSGRELRVKEYAAYFDAIDNERTIDAADAIEDPRTYEFASALMEQGVTSTMDSTIRVGGRTVGILCLEHSGPVRQWTLDEKNFGGYMADLIALAIEASDRQQAQDALRESESKFRAVAETATSAIYVHQGDRFLFCNRASEAISGYSRDELMHMNPFSLVHPDDREFVRSRFELRQKGSSPPARYEYRIITKHGEARWLDFSATMISFEGQTALLGNAFDITDRKRAEQLQAALYRIAERTSAARDLDEFFAAIHAILSELVYARNFYIALHDPRTQFISFPYWVDEQDKPPAPRPLGRGVTEYVLRTGRPALIAPEDERLLHEQGELELMGSPSVDWLGVPLKSGDTTFGVLALQSYSEDRRFGEREKEILTFVSQSVATAIQRKRDEDALRHSEARYRSQIQSAVYGIYRASVDNRFLDVNPALVNMLGYSSVDELLALNLESDVYAYPEVAAHLHLDHRAEDRIDGEEVLWKRKDGKVITVRLSGRTLRDEHGEVEGFEMLAEDVTERRALEDQLRQSQKMEAVGRLAGGVAHDFNNLLTVIKGYSELMLDQLQQADPLRGSIEEVKKAADRAAGLTRQLLAFSRKQVLAPRVLDLNSVVSNMERLLQRLLGEDVELATNLDGQLGRVKADPGQTEQVIMNLAVNARDAMPRGGRLVIGTSNVVLEANSLPQQTVVPGAYVCVRVSDTGVGMTPEIVTRIFEPFFTTKEQGKGTGLGLSTVYGIVQQSGGYIAVESELDKGTTFSVYLPRVDETAETSLPRASTPAKQMGTETILLVEDEDGVRNLARQLLQKQGYSVLDTRHGGEALLVCERHDGPIHLLLTDVILSQMSGRELARRLAQIRPQMKVLYMSGYSGDAVEQHGVLDAGVNFLQKPFSAEGLVAKIREALDAPAAKAAVQPGA